MKLLILGGTADARHLATRLYHQGIPLIYSVAGLVRVPDVPCEIVSGGFSQFGGLENYVQKNSVSVILDATHPYAAKMSTTAVHVAEQSGIACWRFHRQAWMPTDEDHWSAFSNWQALLPALKDKQNVFFTAGQLDSRFLENLKKQQAGSSQRQVLRTAVTPKYSLLETMHWIKAIGPFTLQDELALMKKYQIDALVSKNSGGCATQAKLEAARQLKIPVLMLKRPELSEAHKEFSKIKECESALLKLYSEKTH